MKKVGLLGGTFDPPHLGHLIMAEEARLKKKLDEIWWMPNHIPPHKKLASGISEQDRIKLVAKAAELHPAYRLCTLEMERSGPSYTVDTVRLLQKEYSNKQFYFIMGGDSLNNFHKWYKYDQLKEMIPFIVISRPGFLISDADAPSRMTVLDDVSVELSSTYIRKSLKEGAINRFVLPEGVYEYIKENHLYE
ncbi:nicotinate-nucleotide adenylyltransferase [Salipaludibacillus sp. CUR1]|uniref:nicotinate-nucleotide adenylyltransferase n=1 Tax=Salipaludibacillus sp. CUR1 TaxID=2820003 RepID=UPI001E35F14A|nr:nicotinate-nucleotide adenylyltransferase [Salipaludibacillus sp. CUR1]MCE7794178.1 nicotinate-nucleotide adenylyltransferase [Salipaludibacillus sp. CUR1]